MLKLDKVGFSRLAWDMEISSEYNSVLNTYGTVVYLACTVLQTSGIYFITYPPSIHFDQKFDLSIDHILGYSFT